VFLFSHCLIYKVRIALAKLPDRLGFAFGFRPARLTLGLGFSFGLSTPGSEIAGRFASSFRGPLFCGRSIILTRRKRLVNTFFRFFQKKFSGRKIPCEFRRNDAVRRDFRALRANFPEFFSVKNKSPPPGMPEISDSRYLMSITAWLPKSTISPNSISTGFL
jgi:hypothetical protein